MDIGLGSLVVRQPDGGFVMCVAADAGDDLFCVSMDTQNSVRGWFSRGELQPVRRPDAPSPIFS